MISEFHCIKKLDNSSLVQPLFINGLNASRHRNRLPYVGGFEPYPPIYTNGHIKCKSRPEEGKEEMGRIEQSALQVRRRDLRMTLNASDALSSRIKRT